jgi:predicted exporter
VQLSSLLIAAVCVVVGLRLEFSKDLMELLPRNSPTISEYQQVLARFNPQDTMVFSIHKTASETSTDELIALGDRFFEAIKATGLFREEGLLYRWQVEDVRSLFDTLQKHRANLFTEDDRALVLEKIEPAQVIKTLDDKKMAITLSPAPFIAESFYNDPLDINSFLYRKLAAVQAAGNHLSSFKGRLFTKDFNSLFVFAVPRTKSTDFEASQQLVESVEKIVGANKTKGIGIAYLGGHRYAVKNAAQMTSDINMISILSTLAIIVLCLLVFRRPMNVPLVLLPSIFGAAVAFGVTALISDSISLVAMGCGSILIGISVDYGVHIIFHADQHARLDTQSVTAAMQRILKPLLLSTTTTLAAFLCLQFSDLPMYQQFGRFAAIGLAGALVFAVVVLPTFLPSLKSSSRKPWISTSRMFHSYFSRLGSNKTPRIILVVLISIFCAYGLKNLRIDGDLRNLYGSSPQIREDAGRINSALEEELSKTSVVVKADSIGDALEKNDLVAKRLAELKSKNLVEAFSTLSTIVPGPATQKANEDRWRAVWNPEVISSLDRQLAKQTERLRMEPAFFKNFLSQLTAAPTTLGVSDYEHTILAPMLRNQLSMGKDVMLLTIVKIKNFNLFEEVRSILTSEFKGVLVINSRHLVLQVIDLIASELVFLGSIALIAVAGLLMMFYGFKSGALMILPLLTCLLWSLGAMGWLHMPFNIMNCIMVLFIFGMVEDYSVFLSSAYAEIKDSGVDHHLIVSSNAILVSALTTVLSVGALSLADHPALQAVGRTILITLVTGVAAVFIVVPLIHKR